MLRSSRTDGVRPRIEWPGRQTVVIPAQEHGAKAIGLKSAEQRCRAKWYVDRFVLKADAIIAIRAPAIGLDPKRTVAARTAIPVKTAQQAGEFISKADETAWILTKDAGDLLSGRVHNPKTVLCWALRRNDVVRSHWSLSLLLDRVRYLSLPSLPSRLGDLLVALELCLLLAPVLVGLPLDVPYRIP